MAMRPAAVVVEGANKYYGKPGKSNHKPVLTNLNMTVEQGTIYGLLGPSGCGKTTLLSCVVGRRQLNSGHIWVLGGKPGEKGSGVPGPRVGYMPQEIALVGELTIRDAIYYFGRIYGMDSQKLNERFEFLTNLLELGNGARQISWLSGGTQRRVSLAAALVHEPELLILDEPCVGLDPVLREKIWEFLAHLAGGGTTVIITTHYIDETKHKVDKIGLLRDGYLLAEDPPEEILRKFQVDTLEDAFLKLALRQEQLLHPRRALSASPDVIPETSRVAPMLPPSQVSSQYHSKEDFHMTSSTDILTKDSARFKKLTRSRYKAVFIKSIQQFARNPGGLIFSVIFPLIQTVAFFAAIGHDPRDLRIGVVNEEAALSPWGINICQNTSLKAAVKTDEDTCNVYMLSCWFLEEMERNKLTQKTFNTTEEAKAAVERGDLYGALHFATNFSDALAERVREGQVDDDVVNASTISVWIDNTDNQIMHFLKRQLLKAYEAFTRRTMKACGRPENMVQIPVLFHDPIYGHKTSQFSNFMAPGIMMTIIFFLSAIVTSTLMISERLEGVWERSAVAGVRAQEMLNVHILIQAVVNLAQTLEMMLLSFWGYQLANKGSLLTAGVLLFLQGFSGMCYGFLLSVCCSSYSLSFFISTGSFYPMILLCGILWPLEAMHEALRIISLTLPFTLPSKSLRDIMEKGSSITDPEVYYGYLVTIVWIVITISMCFLRLKLRKD